MPTVWATSASRRLMSPAACAPPVMLEIRKGNLSGLPRKLVRVSSASRSSSGSAWWVKAKRSKPAPRVDCTEASRDSRRCSSLRWAMRETGWPFASSAMGLARGRRGVGRARVIVVHVRLEGIRIFGLALAHHLDEVVDDDRVELRALAGFQLGERELGCAPLAVGAGRRHRGVGIADGHDARRQRGVLAPQAVPVAAAVVPLVVGQDDGPDFPGRPYPLPDA